ncbi:MAG TPA: MarR family transcriptional regulator [Propionibacteriaceae bacterium]|nr:MarR family transcriptional regulator [Propionibacteriaceae bacterium]
MAHVANAAGRGQPAVADPLLVETWQQLMGLVLEQRFRWAEVADELGITQAGLRALLAIDPNQPQSMRELAKAMNCDPSYITAMIDDLERAGLATRLASASDRRVKTVGLTRRGAAALRTARDGLLSPPPQLARLTRTEQKQLGRLLQHGLNLSPDPE